MHVTIIACFYLILICDKLYQTNVFLASSLSVHLTVFFYIISILIFPSFSTQNIYNMLYVYAVKHLIRLMYEIMV